MPPENLAPLLVKLRGEMGGWRRGYGLTELRLFGSVARGDAGPSSDLDVMVAFASTPSLFVLARLKAEIEDVVGRRVDLVMRDGLRPAILKHAMDDAVLL